jgi:hypothetical protein
VTAGNGSDRVPDDVLRRIQEEATPTDCGPHCHQGAVLDALIEELRGMRSDSRDRHRATMRELSETKGAVADLQAQFGQLALLQARTSALAGETASHMALPPQEAARRAPRDSVAPSGRGGVPRRTRGLLAALGVVLGAAAATAATAATRCVEARLPTPVPAAQQGHGGP